MTLVDHRTYDFAPGTLPGWLRLYERVGLPIQWGYLGDAVGFHVTEFGGLNRLVFMFAYRDAADRTERRAAMESDAAWWGFRRQSDGAGAILAMSDRLLRPAPFCPFARLPARMVDQRIYTLRPGKADGWLAQFEAKGLPLQQRFVGGPQAFFTTEVGGVNEVVFFVGYDGLGQRATARAAMEADPEWQAYKAASAGLGALLSQEDQLLTPAAFYRP
jgi:hypothetical protein